MNRYGERVDSINSGNGLIDRNGMHVWDRSEEISWSLVAAGVAGYAFLFTGAYLGWSGGIREVFASYGLWLLICTVALAIIAGGITWEKGTNPTVRLNGDAAHSHWDRKVGSDGKTGTTFIFQMQATNISRVPIRMPLARLLRPRVGKPEVPVETRDPLSNQFGRPPALEPNDTRDIRFVFNVDAPIGRPGKTITAVVSVSDQLGRWHKFKFKKLRPSTEAANPENEADAVAG
jgi:hypothetical protein